MTMTPPRRRMPAFSRAIWAMVEPSHSVWSSEISVITDTNGSTILVASSRPPMPTSTHRRVHLAGSKIEKAHGGEGLEKTRHRGQPAILYQRRGDLLDMEEGGGEVIVVDGGAIHLDALIDAAQVG